MLEWLQQIDRTLFVLINQHLANSVFDVLMPFFSDKWIFLPMYALLAGAVIYTKGRHAWIYLLGVALCIAASDQLSSGIMKPLVQRIRPCNVPELHARILHTCNQTWSFMSSHAANAMTVAVFFLLCGLGIYRATYVVLFFWAFFVAFSRVYNGVHYPFDVICGALAGAMIAIPVSRLAIYMENRFRKTPVNA